MKKQTLLTILGSVLLIAGCTCQKGGDNRSTISGEVVASSSNAIVETQSGKIAGYTEDNLYIYKGVPYATAERFMPPQPFPKWEGTRSCRAYGPTCPQGVRMGWLSDEQAFAFDWDDGHQGENCQVLNIWTPAKPGDSKKRAVMVWLHGGGYSAGSSQELPCYDGANLAKKGDIVVVSVNHRLNVLGFLDLSCYGEKYAQSGNVGVLDLVAALQWVNKNIALFGGDAENVTIFGQSGGGGKVSTLMATPSAKGLFAKAIVQSGSMVRTMEQKYSRRIGSAVMEQLGLKSNEIDKLKDIPYTELLAAGEKAVAQVKSLADAEGNSTFIFGWAPIVDGNVIPTQPFDPVAPQISKDVPMIIGTTLNEFCMSTYVPALRNLSEDKAREILNQKYGERTDDFIAAFKKAYPNGTTQDMIDLDLIFRPGAVVQADAKVAQNGADVYMYLFTWQSPILDGVLRATHCMEMPFTFDNIARQAAMTGGSAAAQSLADIMSSAWINFAKSGNPNGKGVPTWDKYTTTEGATMVFDNDSHLVYGHDRELLNIVRSFPTRGL